MPIPHCRRKPGEREEGESKGTEMEERERKIEPRTYVLFMFELEDVCKIVTKTTDVK